jgi:hypothetical protein
MSPKVPKYLSENVRKRAHKERDVPRVSWLTQSPKNQHNDPNKSYVLKAQKVPGKKWLVALLDSENAPLVSTTSEFPEQKLVYEGRHCEFASADAITDLQPFGDEPSLRLD